MAEEKVFRLLGTRHEKRKWVVIDVLHCSMLAEPDGWPRVPSLDAGASTISRHVCGTLMTTFVERMLDCIRMESTAEGFLVSMQRPKTKSGFASSMRSILRSSFLVVSISA